MSAKPQIRTGKAAQPFPVIVSEGWETGHGDRIGAARTGFVIAFEDTTVSIPETGEVCPSVDAFLIDEIGKMELLCPAFVEAVTLLMDGAVPVIATVALRGEGLIARVKARPDVRLLHVTPDSRDGLPGQLERWLRKAVQVP